MRRVASMAYGLTTSPRVARTPIADTSYNARSRSRRRHRAIITNGRNLWVHWRRIDKDALVVVVDVKLPYPGGSTAYYDAVGQCNVLIAKAIQDAGAELCLPTSRRVDIKK